MERVIDKLKHQLKKRHVDRLKKGECTLCLLYTSSGMFDENGFAIDEDGVLLAYNGCLLYTS